MPGRRPQPGQTARADVPLGQLTVMVDEVLGSTGHRSRRARGGGRVVGAHVQAGEHEVCGLPSEVGCSRGASPFVGSAEVPPSGERRCAPAVLGDQSGQPGRVSSAGEQNDETRAVREVRQHRAQVTPDGRDHDRLLRGPALPGPGEGVAGDGGVDADLVRAEHVDEGRGDAGAQRVTAGEDDGVGVLLDESRHRRAKGGGPGHERGRRADVVGHEVEVPGSTDQGARTRDEGAPPFVQASPPVVPDTHDVDHGRPH